MLKSIITMIISLLILGIASGTTRPLPILAQDDAANPPTSTDLQILEKAYVANNTAALRRYASSDDANLRYYATTLLDVSTRRFDALTHDGDDCFGVIPVAPQAAAAIFQCLFVVTSGSNIANHPKESYLWEARAAVFYSHFWRLIDRGMGRPNPYGVQDLQLPALDVVESWPEQTAAVDSNWRAVPLDHLHIQAKIGDLPVDMIVDTGSTGIALSDRVIEDLQRKNEIVSLDAADRVGGVARTTSAKAYYVPRLQFGPITITNAYVVSANGSQSLLGIKYLALLRQFTLSRDSIRRFYKSPRSSCATMQFSRLGGS